MAIPNVSVTPVDMEVIQEMCDNNIPLYKIAATFDSYNGSLLTEFANEKREEALQAMINRLHRIVLPPNDVFFLNDGSIISAHWYPPFPFFFDDLSELLNLVSNFQSYLDTLDFTTGTIDTDTWYDQENKLEKEEALYRELLGVSVKSRKLEANQIKDYLGNKIWRSIFVYDCRAFDKNQEDLFPNGYY